MPIKYKYHIFNYLSFLSFAFSLTAIAALNVSIDPYKYFFTKKFIGLNYNKPEYEKNIMLSKAAEARHIKAKTILLGSSRVMSGLNSKHPVFKDSETVYNLGLPGTNMYQSLQYFKHAIKFQENIDRVVIGLDFFMFNEYLENLDNFDEQRLGKQWHLSDIVNTSLSLDALQASFNTIVANQKPSKQSKQESTPNKFKRWLTNFLSFEGFYKTYKLSEDRLDNFRQIIELCEANDIKYYVFISPTHATQYEAIDMARLWSSFETWKKEIVSITPVWDFSGYNSITMEKISDSMNNYIDNSHYSHQTGNLVINRIFNYDSQTIPQDFGLFLTADSLESNLQRIRDSRQQWRNKFPAEVDFVREIKLTIDKKE